MQSGHGRSRQLAGKNCKKLPGRVFSRSKSAMGFPGTNVLRQHPISAYRWLLSRRVENGSVRAMYFLLHWWPTALILAGGVIEAATNLGDSHDRLLTIHLWIFWAVGGIAVVVGTIVQGRKQARLNALTECAQRKPPNEREPPRRDCAAVSHRDSTAQRLHELREH